MKIHYNYHDPLRLFLHIGRNEFLGETTLDSDLLVSDESTTPTWYPLQAKVKCDLFFLQCYLYQSLKLNTILTWSF